MNSMGHRDTFTLHIGNVMCAEAERRWPMITKQRPESGCASPFEETAKLKLATSGTAAPPHNEPSMGACTYDVCNIFGDFDTPPPLSAFWTNSYY